MTDRPPIRVSAGWAVEDLEAKPGHTAIKSPSGVVTIDFKMRVYRSGLSTTGRPLNTKMYGGYGWRAELIKDAVEWLSTAVNRNGEQP